MTTVQASSESEICDLVRTAREHKTPFEIVSGGTKRAYGRPAAATERLLDVSRLSGIVAYEPEELILTARPGTTIEEVGALLTTKSQRLGFDPPEWAALFGTTGKSTLGGVVSADASGSKRVRHGGARDHLLGIRAVNGFGEAFKAGGRVVKNVTGFDIPKLVCGAFGTLCVLTELTFRVFPAPMLSRTLVVRDVAPADAFSILRKVWSAPLDATGLSYLPAGAALAGLNPIGKGVALIRVEGEAAPLAEKCAFVRSTLVGCHVDEIGNGEAIFRQIGDGAAFATTPLDVWRVFVPPTEAARVAEAIAAPLWLADWAGALLWIGLQPRDAVAVARLRAATARAGGHAILTRADAGTRSHGGAFPAEDPDRAGVTRAVKSAFDPLALFNPGRMVEGI